MIERDQLLKQHTIHSTLARVSRFLETAALEGAPIAAVEAVDRFKVLVRFLEKLVKSLESNLTSMSLLTNLEGQLSAIETELTAYLGNLANAQALVNAHNRADDAIDIAARVGALRTSSQGQALAEATSAVRLRGDELLKGLDADAKEMSSTLASLSSQISRTEESNTELRSQIEQQKGRLDAAIGDVLRQFSEAEDRRRQASEVALKEDRDSFKQAQSGMETDGKKLLADQQIAFESRRGEVELSAADHIQQLASSRDEARDFVGIIKNIGVTGHYDTEASSERRQANAFRRIALLVMFLIVGGVGLTLWSATTGHSWEEVLLRIGITIALAIPAGYAAREAEHHRVLERHYRRMELELSSIDTYLAKLPEDERIRLKAELTSKFFGRDPVAAPAAPTDKVSLTALDIVRTAIENLTKR